MVPRIIIRANGCWTSNCVAYSIYKSFLKNKIAADIKFVNDNSFNDAYEVARYDYMILEACSVTINLEMMVVDFLGRIKQINPKLKVVICGCGAKNKQSIYYKLDKEVDHIFYSYSDMIKYFVAFLPAAFDNKINDVKIANRVLVKKGCKRFCSYCIVPYVRIPAYDRDAGTILKEIRFLQKRGFKDVKLTGLCISSWKRKGLNFKDLLKKILEEIQIKVSVYEFHPKDIDRKLMRLLLHKNMDRNLSIPLQSGSNKILRMMNRGYTVEYIENLFSQLIEKVPNIKINTELMFGFPYETENDFCMTNKLFDKFPFNRLARIQVYPFSQRPFTKAASFPQIPTDIIKSRINKFWNNHKDLPVIKYGLLELHKKRRIDYFNKLNSSDKLK